MSALLKVLPFGALDWVALAWFAAMWIGYVRFAVWRAKSRPSLLTVMQDFRLQWWRRLVTRELKVIDTSILTVLTNSATFFASTTLLILGGLLALLGTTDKVVAVVKGLPFNAGNNESLWELKILLLVGVFTYAFFKFTWSLRQYNMVSTLVGAAPPVTDDAASAEPFVTRAGTLTHMAAESFNDATRAYYFALAGLGWFLNPYLFMLISTWVVLVLYRREFRSEALTLLTEG